MHVAGRCGHNHHAARLLLEGHDPCRHMQQHEATHMSVLNEGKVELSKRQWGGSAWKDSHRIAIATSLLAE